MYGSPASVAIASGATRSSSSKRRNRPPADATAAAASRSRRVGVGADLDVGVDGLRPGFREERGKSAGGGTRPHDEPAPEAPEPALELFEALAQEAKARGADARVLRVMIVEDEDGHDALAVPRGVPESRVVRHAQVAPEPVDDGHCSRTMLPLRNPAKRTHAA